MAIGRITGQMLQSNLDRSGADIAIDGNLIYVDVTNRRIGINTANPAYSLDSPGNVKLANLIILANTITSNTGKIGFGSISNVVITGGNNYDVIYTNGNGTLTFSNIGSLPDLAAANASIVSINANLGAYQIYANANAATQATSIDTINANVGTLYLGNISVNANLGSYQAWANATFVTSTTETLLDANVGAYQIYANANAATQATSINTINANLGAYQIYANANAATQATSINTINANLGAYQTFANANVSSLQNQITGANTAIQTLNANIGAFETYANLYIGSAAYGNANVAVYLPTYIGNLSPGNVSSTFYGNIHTDYIAGQTGNVINFASTGAMALPSGNSVQYPTANAAGYFRYNTTNSSPEFYNGSGWVSVVNNINDQQIGLADGVTTAFTLDYSVVSAKQLMVSINGVVQTPDVTYTASGTTLTFLEAPAVGDYIDIRYLASSLITNLDVEVIDTANIAVGTSNVIVDSFDSTVYRSAKYSVSSTNNVDSQFAEVSVLQYDGNVILNCYSVLTTGTNTITFYSNVSGNSVNLLAKGTNSANKLRIKRTYFIL